MSGNELRFFLSCDINLPVTFRIDRLEGNLPQSESDSTVTSKTRELYVECALYMDGALFGLPTKTRLETAAQQYCWNEFITLNTKYRDLTAHAQLCLTALQVWDVSCGSNDGLIGGATVLLFNSKKQLKSGKQKLRLWPRKEADGSFTTTTPGKVIPNLHSSDVLGCSHLVPRNERGELERLEKMTNKYERGQIQRIDWMDLLAFRALDQIKERESSRNGNSHLSLVVDFCSLEHRVVFQESDVKSFSASPVSPTNELVVVWDPEVGRVNPSEHKQLKLARSLTRGIIDRDLKPSSNERNAELSGAGLKISKDCNYLGSELQSYLHTVNTENTQVSSNMHAEREERQLLWKFRFSLMSEKRALTKFLRCVEWSDVQEAKQALDLMGKWETIDVTDALELLSPVFESEEVRAYAVSVLERADDDELQCYLLQLVQALRFERSDKSRLALFLVKRFKSERPVGEIPSGSDDNFLDTTYKLKYNREIMQVGRRQEDMGSSLYNIELASFLRWYVAVELHDPAYAKRFYCTYEIFEDNMMKMATSVNGDENGFKLWQSLVRQTELTAQLCSIMRDVTNVRGGTQKKIQKLRQLLSGLLSELTYFEEPIRSPLAPGVLITGIVPAESSIFKSALHPLRLTFRTASGGICKVIFKKGDDIRQDQLVVQMVSLMDRLLKLENLDLHLTPYRVLATGPDEGMLEFIPSSSLAQILSEHRSIVTYLQKFHPDEDGPFGITATCLETFIKSCAGYSVITYILGIGDRHLDNLLLRDDGRLFHVDFGFILGRDPKPFPPPMKLCKEMVEAMGGAESQYYTRFKSYCCEAYNILRKSNNLILNLFHLMAGSRIHDIALDPEKSILKLQEKFRLDLDDEEAVHFFQDLINESVSALFPQMVETIHRWAQYWR
ncbi:hypothetical protein QJS10_CPA03g00525 [Acorus calamus]|uniref:phosphatidylinositol 3-kinase n=2 Tax=Magnoliopsida TaxID=3398 RepID=A0AAV9F6Q1_ACOCL|nr:hypothetical protein QJS10_CPA03g00525 [Acorus calamus]